MSRFARIAVAVAAIVAPFAFTPAAHADCLVILIPFC
jgi:hypothetical protein